MSAQKRSTQSINLLPREKLDDSNSGKTIRWLLSTFRTIVILVQVIVIAAFAGRIFLDSRISSLNKQIEEKQALVTSYKEIEDTFLISKLKLDTYSLLQDPNNSYRNLLDVIAKETPVDTQLTAINRVGSQLVIEGRTDNNLLMYLLASRLNSSGIISNAQVSEIKQDSTTQSLTEFIIQANVQLLE